jgi:tight adherence protein B
MVKLAAAVLGALAILIGSAPANAAPTPEFTVSGVQAMPGEVRFFLAARNLPPGQALTTGTVRVAVGGVQRPVRVESGSGSTVDRPARAVVIAVDTSGSMAGAAIAAARTAALQYAAALPTDVKLGLVSFADRATVVLAPTVDRDAFAGAVGALTAGGGTALFDAVAAAAELLAGEYLERHLVVLSDGADTASTRDARDAVKAAAKPYRIPVDVVAYGTPNPAAAALATDTGGQLVPAADAGQLRDAFHSLAAALSVPVLVTVSVPADLGGTGTLSLTIDGAPSTLDVPVTFRADPAAAAPATSFRGTAPPRWPLLVAVLTIGLATLLGAGALTHRFTGRSAMRSRLRQVDRYTVDRIRANVAAPDDKPANAFVRSALALSQRAVDRRGRQSRIEASLERAGIDLRPAEWLLARTGAAAGFAVLLALVFPVWLGVPLGLAAGWLLTGVYRKVRASRRAARFAELLPEALQLVVGAIRSGFSLGQAFDALVREGPEPVASELGRALAETRLGGELEDALDRAAARNDSEDLAWLVMAIRIQREVGGNLSEVLQTAVETMRERERLNRHVRALSAEGRLSAYVLISMPILLAAWLFTFRGAYLRPLYTEPLGIAMLLTAAVMVAVGAFWMSRLIKVDV